MSGVRIDAHVKYHDGLVRPDYTSAFQQISVRTDQSGEFSVTGQQGEGLFIDRLEMDGYVVAQLGPQTFDALYHVPGNTQWPIQLSKDSPAILRIWKKGEPAALIERGTTVLTAADEHVKRFQLEGVPIEMELQWSRTGTWTDPQAWSITLKVIDGGIMEHTDAFPYEAPASGYQAQWTENRVRGTPEWTPNFRKRFYLTAANGKYYGHTLINFDPFFRERTHLGMSYSINPNGSRNLLSASER